MVIASHTQQNRCCSNKSFHILRSHQFEDVQRRTDHLRQAQPVLPLGRRLRHRGARLHAGPFEKQPQETFQLGERQRSGGELRQHRRLHQRGHFEIQTQLEQRSLR